MPIGRQLGAEQPQHVLGRKRFDFFERVLIKVLDQHRRGRLADAAPVAVEVNLFDLPVRLQRQFDPHDVAAEGIIVLMGVRRPRSATAVVRILVMLEDVFLIQFFFVGRHEWRQRRERRKGKLGRPIIRRGAAKAGQHKSRTAATFGQPGHVNAAETWMFWIRLNVDAGSS